MGNMNECVTGRVFTAPIYNAPNVRNIVDICSNGCNRIGVKNFVTGITATLESITGYGVNTDIVSVYDNVTHVFMQHIEYIDLESYDRFQLIGMLEDMTK